MNEACELFLSYSHADEDFRLDLEKHLAGMKRLGVVSGWHDRMIRHGDEWEREIDVRLNAASVILLLISKNFLASNYCYDIEMKRALERHEAGEARVVPIILKPVVWKNQPFAKLNGLPRNGKAITTWRNRDEAFVDVAHGLGDVIAHMRKQSKPAEPSILELEKDGDECGGGVGTLVTTGTTSIEIELTINHDFNDFSQQDKQKLLDAIGMLLETGRQIKVIRQRRGSVKLTLRLRPDEAERLIWAVAQGGLDGFNVVAADIVGTIERERSGSKHTNGVQLLESEDEFTEATLEQIGFIFVGLVSSGNEVERSARRSRSGNLLHFARCPKLEKVRRDDMKIWFRSVRIAIKHLDEMVGHSRWQWCRICERDITQRILDEI
jgi:hypothetical protein